MTLNNLLILVSPLSTSIMSWWCWIPWHNRMVNILRCFYLQNICEKLFVFTHMDRCVTIKDISTFYTVKYCNTKSIAGNLFYIRPYLYISAYKINGLADNRSIVKRGQLYGRWEFIKNYIGVVLIYELLI